MNDKFSIPWLQAAAEHVYGKSITDRSFRKWLRICGIKPYSREVSKSDCKIILGLAFLKSQQPYKKFTRLDAMKLIISDRMLSQNLNEALGDSIVVERLPGKQAPTFIQRSTGRVVSVRTLYRWAKKHGLKFSAKTPVPRTTLDKFLEIAVA